MDNFFIALRKGLVAMMCILFAFVVTYIPQIATDDVPMAEAGGIPGVPQLVYDPTNTAKSAVSAVQDTVAASTAVATLAREKLNAIAWSMAKRVVSHMVRDIIDWVNSGFKGSPAFVTDIGGLLRNVADDEIGRFINEELGSVGSFICSPFRLDVQISIATQYNRARTTGQNAPTCTLSGVIDNIEGFIAGVDPGNGLADWLTITSAPQTYTPYGAQLNAESIARARLINAQGQVLQELNWGDGFLSQKVCEPIAGGGESCSIVKPGAMIADSLKKALGAGQDTLIAADEIDEFVSALMGQVAQKAVTGVNGLLGLSGGNSYSYTEYDGSFLNQLQGESDQQLTDRGGIAVETITESLALERKLRTTAQAYQAELTTFITNSRNPVGEQANALALYELIGTEITRSTANIVELLTMQATYDTATTDQQIDILIKYEKLNLSDANRVARLTIDWERAANEFDITIE